MTKASHLKSLIASLSLQPHPEGGWYREVYRSSEALSPRGTFRRFSGPRPVSTSIYFLLPRGDFSGFHQLKSDEIWHFYEGADIGLHLLHPRRGYRKLFLGSGTRRTHPRQALIPSGTWFAAELTGRGPYALVGCTVAPGFDFRDFQLAESKKLQKCFPRHARLIRRLCRPQDPRKDSR